METDDYSLSPESPFAAEQMETLRRFIRQEVRRALAECTPPPVMKGDELQRELVQRILTQPYRERIVIGEPNATITPVQWQEVPMPMQRTERLASVAGVSYEEAEREIAREEGN